MATSKSGNEGGTDAGPGVDERPLRKERTGVIISDAMDKTVVVRVGRRVQHPLYKKGVVRSQKFHVHDPENEYRTGDEVRIRETRPLSRKKRWRVSELLKRPERA